MNFYMKHAPGAGSIIRPVDLQFNTSLLYYDCSPLSKRKHHLDTLILDILILSNPINIVMRVWCTIKSHMFLQPNINLLPVKVKVKVKVFSVHQPFPSTRQILRTRLIWSRMVRHKKIYRIPRHWHSHLFRLPQQQ